MSNSRCDSRYNCIDISVLASVIIGVIAGVLRYTAVITLTPAFLWVVLGIAVAYLAVVLYSATRPNNPFICAYNTLTVVLIAILIAALFAVILLGVTFAATSITGAVFAGILVGALALLISATVCLVKRIVICNR